MAYVILCQAEQQGGVVEQCPEGRGHSVLILPAYLAFYVEELGADLGAGWDCDGDRVEIVLPDNSEFTKINGRMLSGQYILALVVDEILSEQKGEVVINDATSNLIKEIAEKHNAKVEEVETGEINVVEKMDEVNATRPVDKA